MTGKLFAELLGDDPYHRNKLIPLCVEDSIATIRTNGDIFLATSNSRLYFVTLAQFPPQLPPEWDRLRVQFGHIELSPELQIKPNIPSAPVTQCRGLPICEPIRKVDITNTSIVVLLANGQLYSAVNSDEPYFVHVTDDVKAMSGSKVLKTSGEWFFNERGSDPSRYTLLPLSDHIKSFKCANNFLIILLSNGRIDVRDNQFEKMDVVGLPIDTPAVAITTHYWKSFIFVVLSNGHVYRAETYKREFCLTST